MEFDAAADWYDQQRTGLGIEFTVKVREALHSIAANPHLYPVVYKGIRKAAVRRFPYAVLYHEDATEVLVIAVFHASRNPAIWKSRA